MFDDYLWKSYVYRSTKLRPQALSCDVIMYAVEIWGQERGKKRVSGCSTCGQKKCKRKGKNDNNLLCI